MEASLIPVRVKSMTWLASPVLGVVLESLDGRPLPEAAPGSHVDVHLAPGLARSYSVVGAAGAAHRYEIAVAREAASRGGSRHVHDQLRVGAQIAIGAPRNHFPLVDAPGPVLLIAGGIGITPIWSMARWLEARQRPWTLFYAARSRSSAAYLDDIEALARTSARGRLITHFDDERGQPPDLRALVATAPAEAHLYACGPQPMLAAFEAATADRPASQVHLERFKPVESAGTAASGCFTVRLHRSGRDLEVPPDRSILDVMLEHGIDTQYGCMQGACGMCETPVLGGTPDHRDSYLPDEVKARQRSLLICCSRSVTPVLELDA